MNYTKVEQKCINCAKQYNCTNDIKIDCKNWTSYVSEEIREIDKKESK